MHRGEKGEFNDFRFSTKPLDGAGIHFCRPSASNCLAGPTVARQVMPATAAAAADDGTA